MTNFNHETAWMHDEQTVVSNLVYSINERAKALMWSYSITNDCTSPTSRVYRYWVDPIPLESWEIAWGTNNELRVVSWTNTVSVFTNGAFVAVTSTVHSVTNRIISFEYPEGVTLPYGYLFVPVDRFGYAGAHYGVWPGYGRPDTWYTDETGRLVSNILVRVVTNDFSNPDGLRLTSQVSYQPCRATNEYYFQATTLMEDIYDRVFDMTSYYLRAPTNQNNAKPMWRFIQSTRRGPMTFTTAGDLPGIIGDVWPCQGGVYDEVYGDCWAYVWDNEWHKLAPWSPVDNTEPMSLDDLFTGTSAVGRVTWWTNAVLGAPGTVDIEVDGWHVGKLDDGRASIVIPSPAGRCGISTSYYYSVTGDPFYASVDLVVPSQSNEYVVSITSAPVADISYVVTDLTLTSDPPRRVIKPMLTTYTEAFRDLDPALYTTSELSSVSWLVVTIPGTNGTPVQFPPHSLSVKINSQNYGTEAYPGGQYVFEGDYPRGWYWWSVMNPTSVVSVAETTQVVRVALESLSKGPTVIRQGGHELVSISISNEVAVTQRFINVSSTPGETNFGWVPAYDLARQHRVIVVNPLPTLMGVTTNVRTALRGSPMAYSPDLAADLWALLRQMKYTRVAAAAFSDSNYGWTGRGYTNQVWSPMVVTSFVFWTETDLNGDYYDRSSTNYAFSGISTTALPAEIYRRWITSGDAYGLNPFIADFNRSRRREDFNGMWATGSSWRTWQEIRIDAVGAIAFDAIKHPDLSGTLMLASTLEYAFSPERGERLVQSATVVPDSDRRSCIFDATYIDHYYQMAPPPDYVVDLGLEYTSVASAGTEILHCHISIGLPAGMPPEVGYDDRGVASGPSPCTDWSYGHALRLTEVSATRRTLAYWRWDFRYAAD